MDTPTLPPARLGTLMPFAESGTEGIIWSVELDGPTVPMNPYANLTHLNSGDQLTIYGADGRVAWQGTLDFDDTVRQAKHWWVYGMPRDVEVSQWLDFFFHEPPLRCRLLSRRDQIPFGPPRSAAP